MNAVLMDAVMDHAKIAFLQLKIVMIRQTTIVMDSSTAMIPIVIMIPHAMYAFLQLKIVMIRKTTIVMDSSTVMIPIVMGFPPAMFAFLQLKIVMIRKTTIVMDSSTVMIPIVIMIPHANVFHMTITNVTATMYTGMIPAITGRRKKRNAVQTVAVHGEATIVYLTTFIITEPVMREAVLVTVVMSSLLMTKGK